MSIRCRWILRVVCAGVALLTAPAPELAALQLGVTADVRAGAAAWDQLAADGPLARGALGAIYRTSPLLGLQPELTGGLGLGTDPAARTATAWDLGARLHTRGATTAAWIGAAVGGAAAGTRTAALSRLEGGVRRAIGPAGVDVWVSRTTFGSRPATGGGLGQDRGLDTDTVPGRRLAEYTDLASRATLGLGNYELGATLVQRLGRGALRRTGWELNAVWWLAPSVGLVGAVGHSLPQVGVAVPAARYGTLGVRLALGAASRAARKPSTSSRDDAATAPHLVLASERRLAIVGPAAERAEVMGDFTNWEVRRLVPAGDGRWTYPDALSPGVHQLNVRFDGSNWLVPEGALAVDDGFGGRAGLFVVR
jgi:hypothetical protein